MANTGGVYVWSQVANNNATADNTVNWSEGQSPSSVNDSARAMMASTAKWRDDISGSIVTSGTSTAYVVSTNQVFDNLADMNGQMIAIVPHTTNGPTVTLTTDAVGTKPLRSSPGVELGAGVMIQGTPYVATYNNSDAAWYLHNFVGNPYNVPLGGLLATVDPNPPNSNFALPYGQALSRTTYATLFNKVSTTFGAGDGTTTFNILDLRGRFIAGLGNMGGSDAGRITVAGGNFDGTVLGATGGAQNHTLITGEMPAHTHIDSGHQHNLHDKDPAGALAPNSGGLHTFRIDNGPQIDPSGSLALGVTDVGTANLSTVGSGNPHTILPPVIILPSILRII